MVEWPPPKMTKHTLLSSQGWRSPMLWCQLFSLPFWWNLSCVMPFRELSYNHNCPIVTPVHRESLISDMCFTSTNGEGHVITGNGFAVVIVCLYAIFGITVRSPIRKKTYLNMVRLGPGESPTHMLCHRAVSCWRVASFYFGMACVCAVPRWLPVIRRGLKHQHENSFLSEILFESHHH